MLLWAIFFVNTTAARALPSKVVPAADVAHGEQVFRLCASCHNEREDALGPSLRGVMGRKAGTVEGFRYSNAMKRAGFTWGEDNISAYLRDPQAVVKGNRMPFSGLTAPADLADVIGFLKQLK